MLPVQVSPRHKLVGVPFSPQVLNLFPGSREMDFAGEKHLLVRHDNVAAYLLRKLGYDCPAPILSQYAWPGATTPFDVQRKTCAMLTTEPRAYVLNAMGTGKSKSALWAWDYLRSNGLCGKLLVLAPLSTLNFVWAREVFSTLPHRKCSVLHGNRKRRLERLNDPDAEIFILNHDGLKVLDKELTKRTGPDGDIDVLVIDELAVCRNGTASRTKTTRKLAERMKWVWGMTGSPIPNCPTDAWAEATVVTPNTVPKYFGRFREDLMIRVSQFKWAPKEDAVERAFAALQPAVRFTLDDVVELPDFIERTVDVELGDKQADIYKKLVTQCHAAVQSKEITAANAGAVMNKLLQISTGWVYTSDKSVVALDGDARLTALTDAIEATSDKVIVFVNFKHALAGISSALTKLGVDHAVVSGDTSATERSEIFNLFQNTDKYRVLVAHPACMSHGVTLTRASSVVWFSPTTSNETFEQANARIRRVGQKSKQLYLYLQASPIEKRVYSMLRAKQKVQQELLTMFEEASRADS